jgi:IclR helix-turn-helix domain
LSRKVGPGTFSHVVAPATDWQFLTNHGLALVCIAADPGMRLRDIADRIGITERAAHRIVSGLVESGYVSRERNGRRNTYEVRADLPVRLPVESNLQLGDLLGAVLDTRDQQAAAS